MNMFKKNGGFTLVELIVVIAILAILAAVAVPAYSGYIAKAEEASKLQTLSAVNTAAQGLAAAEQTSVTRITVMNGEVTVQAAGEKFNAGENEVEVGTAVSKADIKTLIDPVDLEGYDGAYMVGNEWTLVKEKCDACAEGDTNDGYCDTCGLIYTAPAAGE